MPVATEPQPDIKGRHITEKFAVLLATCLSLAFQVCRYDRLALHGYHMAAGL